MEQDTDAGTALDSHKAESTDRPLKFWATPLVTPLAIERNTGGGGADSIDEGGSLS
jgi:hypothetical protein